MKSSRHFRRTHRLPNKTEKQSKPQPVMEKQDE